MLSPVPTASGGTTSGNASTTNSIRPMRVRRPISRAAGHASRAASNVLAVATANEFAAARAAPEPVAATYASPLVPSSWGHTAGARHTSAAARSGSTASITPSSTIAPTIHGPPPDLLRIVSPRNPGGQSGEEQRQARRQEQERSGACTAGQVGCSGLLEPEFRR